jgi:hypothetical protein
MGGGGQREAAEEDRECFVHVFWVGDVGRGVASAFAR